MSVLYRLVSVGLLFLPVACADPADDVDSGHHNSAGTPLRGDGPQLVVRAGTASLPHPAIEHIFVDVDRVAAVFVGENEPRSIGRELTFDLIELVNGRDIVLGETTSSRNVKSVHLDISRADVRLYDGTAIERRFPFHGPARLELSGTTPLDTRDLFVQFDLERSLFRIPERGEDPDQMLVHFIARLFDGSRLSSIGGRVMDDAGTPNDPDDDHPIADAPVVLERGDWMVARSRTDRDGTYRFVGPYAGDFDVVCVPEAGMTNARAVHAMAPSVTGDADFLYQVTEYEGW
jgi:hypothetical protein